MKFNLLIPKRKLPPYALAAIKEYEKRLSRYCKINHTLFKSTDQLMKKIPPGDLLCYISPGESTHSSESFAEQMDHWGLMGNSSVTFIIDAEGELSELMDESTLTMHLTTLTLSTGMLTTLLTEQLYRGYRIIHNQAYHK